ncbi:MAG TPA: class I SAM-dependent methyltransferase [Bacillota bacterium]|nr:class I SAM-dependent methyltransferase [Bacillota bacterium]
MNPINNKASSYSERVTAFYNSTSYDAKRGHAGQPPKEAARLFRSFCQSLPQNGLIGDYGCGNGLNFGRSLLQNGLQYLGIDDSSAQLSYAAHKLPQASLLLADYTTFSFPADYFDGILLINSLQETEAQRHAEILHKITCQLKMHGSLLFALPVLSNQTTEELLPSAAEMCPAYSVLELSAYEALLIDYGFCILEKAEIRQSADLASFWLLAEKQ